MKMIKTIKKYQDESSQLFVNKAEYVRKGILEDDLLRKEYLFCRANKHNFMPESSIDDTIFFENIQAHKRLRIVEDKTEHNVLMDLISAEGNMNFLKDSSEKPHIFCSFHFGSFMQIGPSKNTIRLLLLRKVSIIFNKIPEEFECITSNCSASTVGCKCR